MAEITGQLERYDNYPFCDQHYLARRIKKERKF